MRGTVAKRLRKQAEQFTVGESASVTRRLYRMLKRHHKTGHLQ